MSFSPFPRGEIPPPVPPKAPVPHIATLATANISTVSKHKRSAPSLSKAVSFGSFVDFCSNSRNPSPTKQLESSASPIAGSLQTKAAPSTTVLSPREMSNLGVQNSPSQPSSGFSLASAKQRAKGVFMARRKGSQSDLETMTTVQEVCMDSPTIPGRPARYQEPEAAGGWRSNEFGGILMAGISSPPGLDNIPVFVERSLERTRTQRPRADSAPPVRHNSTRTRTHFDAQRPGSADSVVPPRHQHHKRKKSSISSSLPPGVRPSKAPIHYPRSQIEFMQTAAKLQSEKFCVLGPGDVEGLSRELSQLDTRCQYLRETQKSLRDGRRTLHSRMLTYLRSARSAVFSRENLLKQEEALAELDAAIDDWQSKLEKAQDRRSRVKEKLLEHLAATLSVPDCTHSPPERGLNTPPSTPERQGRDKFSDSQSITIYALLADVEQGIHRSTLKY